MPPYACASDARELCTIILTTSPIPSVPSTALFEKALDSVPKELRDVNLIITFDCASSIDEVSRLKKGRVSQEIMDQYPEYIRRIKDRFGRSSDESLMHNTYISSPLDPILASRVTFLRAQKRLGFGWSVRLALQYVDTPIVLVLQHDWVFNRPAPSISPLLQTLVDSDAVQYITFVTRSMKQYTEKQGKSCKYFQSITQAYEQSQHGLQKQENLVPCFHFFDKPHLCKVSTYKRVFDGGLVGKGHFIEDTFGTAYVTRITQAPSPEIALSAWLEFGCFLHYPLGGKIIALSHTHGRIVLECSLQKRRIEGYRCQ